MRDFSKSHFALLALVAVSGFVLGLAAHSILTAGGAGRGAESPGRESPSGAAASPDEAASEAVYTCSMHPGIRLKDPDALCPICNMRLIPVEDEDTGGDAGPREIRLTETARRLAEIRTTPVERRFVDVRARLTGKIELDETRVKHVAARVAGRIERMFVNFTGVRVNRGEHLFELYSPELLVAEQELLMALENQGDRDTRRDDLTRGPGLLGPSVASLREKLRLWGLTPDQISEIERRRTASDRVTIYAPRSGVVVEKNMTEGEYVETGTRVYTIADLSGLWLMLDAYESDLTWLRYGQEVEFEVEAWPGRRFAGRISFLAPMLDEMTRTVDVRVNVPNPDGRLKPGMFARAVARARVASGGRVIDPDLAGKHICRMHPEVVSDVPGDCDECGMPLVTARSLGYATATSATRQAPLVIPASAPLITGPRAVVYVKSPHDAGLFEGREVALGPRAGDDYIVESGLEEGEEVVTRGAFKIDSAMQIQARPSMMSPADSDAPRHGHTEDHSPRQGHAEHRDSAVHEARKAPESDTPRTSPTLAALRAAYPLDVCVVSGEPLGSMGEPVEIVHNGRLVRFCCEGCRPVFLDDPEAFLARIDNAATTRARTQD